MDGQAVNYDLRRLAGFLNLTDKRLDEFDEKDPRPPIDGGEESFVLMALRYMTGTKDTGESLKALRTNIKDHLLALLNPEIAADKAVANLLDRIDGLGLGGFRTLRDEKRHENQPSTNVDIIRISPATVTQQGKQPPLVETVAIVEVRYDDSASKSFYRIVDDALQKNTIWQVRNCLHCKKFYIDSRKLTYCSTPCETAFNNERKRQKRLIQKEEIKKSKKRQSRKNNETAGRELYQKIQQLLSRRAKLTNEEKRVVQRVFIRLSPKARDIKNDWSQISLDVKKSYARAAEVL
jgi:hypothetical protein